MSDFFNKYFNIKKIIEDKREYREQMARMKKLPKDYRFVYEKIQNYMWMHASGDGMDMLKIQYDLLDLFDEGAANGKDVLEITGQDVAAFADELLKNAKVWTGSWAEKLNRDVANEIGKSAK